MERRTLTTLEFDKVRERMADLTATPLGRERLQEMEPHTSLQDAEAELAAVDECLRILWAKGAPAFTGVTDVRAPLRRAKVGGMLSADDLNQVAHFIAGGRAVRLFLEDIIQELDLQRLRARVSELFDARQTEIELRKAIAEDGTVFDNASPELRRLRMERRQLEARVRAELEHMLRTHQKYLQESVIAMRGEFLCLPVRVEYKAQVPGVVRDYSASGATVYVEPQAVIDLHRRIGELRAAEEREIERILIKLSGLVGTVADDLERNVQVLGELDAWFGKALYAKTEGATRPLLRTDGVWRIRRGRHPLLPRETAVPMDLTLGESFRVLVITGPNTGGKTVALKTVGLLTLLAMAGCFVTAAEGTEIGWCDGVYVDIGDEQSIEQSLSTFSSHLRNIVHTLERVTERSLVLLDEIGAGTDPAEGAALAMAILNHLKRIGCTVMATTHYAELKAYAFHEPGVRNASVEFDVETLRPTYRLIVGLPGRSNAIAIARRLGLPEEVLKEAQTAMGQQDVRVETMIARMDEARRQAEAAWAEAAKERAEAERLRAEWEARSKALEDEESRIRERAVKEARDIVERARREAERVIAELRERERTGSAKDHELVELRKSLEEALPEEVERRRPARRGQKSLPLRVGAVVHVPSVGQKGEVVEVSADGREVTVQLGWLKTKLSAQDVEVVEAAPQRTAVTTVRPKLEKTVGLELDVRGQTLEEALRAVDKYLDDAVLSGLARVYIIHGKGTGVLRDGIRRYLSRHSQVSSWAPGGPGEGGDGVTVVEVQK